MVNKFSSVGSAAVLLLACASTISAQQQTINQAQTVQNISTAQSSQPQKGAPAKAQDRTGSPAGNFKEASAYYYQVGAKYALEGKHELAAKAFQKVILLDPKSEDAYFSLGNVYADTMRWPEAVEQYTNAIRLKKFDAEAHNKLGIAYLKMNDYKSAVKAFKEAARLSPNWPEPRLHLIDADNKLKQSATANTARQKAKLIQPTAAVAESKKEAVTRPVTVAARRNSLPASNDANALYKLGVKYGRASQYVKAIEAFQQAIQIKKDYADAYYGLGHAYGDLGHWQQAVKAYEQVVRLDPKDEEAYTRLGEAYAKSQAQKPATAASDSNINNLTNSPNNATANATGALTVTDPTSIYRVGIRDVLDVRLLNSTAGASTLYTVSASGLLEYPLLSEPLKVTGLTTDEIAALVTNELKRRAPKANSTVDVGVRDYDSHTIIVSGLVREPGSKVIRREAIPLYVVIADAQALASAGRAEIIERASKGNRRSINLSDKAAMNTLIYPGDVINVLPRAPQFFYVGGRVNAPGKKDFHQGITLTQAVLSAGHALSEKGHIKVTRQNADSLLIMDSYNLKDIIAGKIPDPLVQPDDRIEVTP